MKTLLYIHGYNGSPEGRSCSLFRRYLSNEGWNVIGMDYFQDDCKLALQQIKETISSNHVDVVVGSSLGGFLTLLTSGIERIVINPCYLPSIELPKLGPWNGLPAPSPDMIASYESFEPQIKKLAPSDKELVTGCFAMEDEMLGDRYQKEFREDIGEVHLIPGGHHISEDAVKEICEKYLLGKD